MLPCPYVHIGLGNVFDSSLKDISNKGFRVKKFRDNSQKCLAGEDLDFISQYMAKDGTTIFNPAVIEDLFKSEDMYEDDVLA